MDWTSSALIAAGIMLTFELIFWLGECFGNAAADAEIARMRRREEKQSGQSE